MTETSSPISVGPISLVQGAWWVVALLGLVSVALGILAIVWPVRTLLVVIVVLGIYLLVAGMLRFAWSILDDSANLRGPHGHTPGAGGVVCIAAAESNAGNPRGRARASTCFRDSLTSSMRSPGG